MSSPLSRPSTALRAGWRFSLYPDAAEGGGALYRPRDPDSIHKRGSAGLAKDADRSAVEAGRRARASVRRYCAANRLNRLGTLTYAGNGCFDPLQVREDLGEFFRNLRMGLGGEPIPYLWVPEWHPGGHGLHAHFAVGQFVTRKAMTEAWHHGFFKMKPIGDLPVGSGSLSEARRAAGYLSKYIAKTFTEAESRREGLHRYDVAQGFAPTVVSLTGLSSDEVIEQASTYFDAAPARRWDSSQNEDWVAPPAVWAQWGQ